MLEEKNQPTPRKIASQIAQSHNKNDKLRPTDRQNAACIQARIAKLSGTLRSERNWKRSVVETASASIRSHGKLAKLFSIKSYVTLLHRLLLLPLPMSRLHFPPSLGFALNSPRGRVEEVIAFVQYIYFSNQVWPYFTLLFSGYTLHSVRASARLN